MSHETIAAREELSKPNKPLILSPHEAEILSLCSRDNPVATSIFTSSLYPEKSARAAQKLVNTRLHRLSKKLSQISNETVVNLGTNQEPAYLIVSSENKEEAIRAYRNVKEAEKQQSQLPQKNPTVTDRLIAALPLWQLMESGAMDDFLFPGRKGDNSSARGQALIRANVRLAEDGHEIVNIMPRGATKAVYLRCTQKYADFVREQLKKEGEKTKEEKEPPPPYSPREQQLLSLLSTEEFKSMAELAPLISPDKPPELAEDDVRVLIYRLRKKMPGVQKQTILNLGTRTSYGFYIVADIGQEDTTYRRFKPQISSKKGRTSIPEYQILKSLPRDGFLSAGDFEGFLGLSKRARSKQEVVTMIIDRINRMLEGRGERVINVAEAGEAVYHRTTIEKAKRIEEGVSRARARAERLSAWKMDGGNNFNLSLSELRFGQDLSGLDEEVRMSPDEVYTF